MNPATLTTSTFTLAQAGTDDAAGGHRLLRGPDGDARPRRANLDASTTYTATVKGGAAGVKDLAGNALAADVDLDLHDAAAG